MNRPVEDLIITALKNGPRITTIRSPLICLDDIRAVGHARFLTQVAELLSQLVGRTVDRVVWENTPDKDTNPEGNIGSFAIYLRP